MTPDQFETMMQSWGWYYGERRGPEWQEAEEVTMGMTAAAATVHPLARAQAFAPGKRSRFIEGRVHSRGGEGRRRMMGAAAGVAMVPAAYVDPIPCVETREAIGTPRPDPRYTEAIRSVQEAWTLLRKWWPLQAEIVRLHYQVRGYNQAEKATFATAMAISTDTIGPKRFKDELRLAKTWLHARLAK